jgi:transcriptional regulator with XRE-family HTH domain
VTNSLTLGERLRARRKDLDLTLAEVADLASLSLPYVSNLERGRGNPTIEALRSLAVALQTSLSALLGEIGDDADPLELLLRDAPASLRTFARGPRFADAVERQAARLGMEPDDVRRRMLASMAAAPRRSSGEPSEEDWRRLLDVYSLITEE